MRKLIPILFALMAYPASGAMTTHGLGGVTDESLCSWEAATSTLECDRAPTGNAAELVTGGASTTDGVCTEWDANGNLVDAVSGLACGAGGVGDDVSIDGVAADDPDFTSDGDLEVIRCTGAGAPDSSCVALEDVIYRYNAGSIVDADIAGGAAIDGDKVEITAESDRGTIQLATQTEVNDGVEALKGVTPDTLEGLVLAGGDLTGTVGTPVVTDDSHDHTDSTHPVLDDHISAVGEIDDPIKTVAAAKIVMALAQGTDGTCVEWDATNGLVDSAIGGACGAGGGGDNVFINGVAATDPDFRDSTGITFIRCTAASTPHADCLEAEDVVAHVISVDLEGSGAAIGIVDDFFFMGFGNDNGTYIEMPDCDDDFEKLDFSGATMACIADNKTPEVGEFGNAVALETDGDLSIDTVGLDELDACPTGQKVVQYNSGIPTCEDAAPTTLTPGADGDLLIFDTASSSYENQPISGDATLDEAGAMLVVDVQTDAIMEIADIATVLKTVAAARLVMANAQGTDGICVEWDATLGLVDAGTGSACGSASGGDNVSIDGVAATDPDFRSEGDIEVIRCTAASTPDSACVEAEDVIFRYQAGSIDDADIAGSAGITGTKVDQATEGVRGTAELATQAEADSGGTDLAIITPLKLQTFALTNHLGGTLAAPTVAATHGTAGGSHHTEFIPDSDPGVDHGDLAGGAGITEVGGVIATASTEVDFIFDLGASALSCVGGGGRMGVFDTTVLGYCDGNASPAHHYVADADSAGLIEDFGNAADLDPAGQVVDDSHDHTDTTHPVVADHIDAVTQIDDPIKTVAANLIVMANAQGTDGWCVEWDATLGLVDAATGAACGSGGSGDNVFVNGVASTDPDFRDSTDILFTRCTAASTPHADCLAAEDVVAHVIDDSHDHAAGNITGTHAGTDLTVDLEEESEIRQTVVADDADLNDVLIGSGTDTASWRPLPNTGSNGCSGQGESVTYEASTRTWGCAATTILLFNDIVDVDVFGAVDGDIVIRDQTGDVKWEAVQMSVDATMDKLGVVTVSANHSGSEHHAESHDYDTHSGGVPDGDYDAQSIDGDDIKTSLAGRSLTMNTGATPDQIDIDAEIYEKQYDIVINDIDATKDFLFDKVQNAITITDIHCIIDPAGSGADADIEIMECNTTGDSCVTVDAAINCDNTGSEDDGSLSNGAIAAGNWLQILSGACTGTCDFTTVTVYYTVND